MNTAKKYFKAAGMKARADNENRGVPEDIVGKLIYFTGIPDDSPLKSLDKKLILVSGKYLDEKGDITGFAINKPARKKFGQYMEEFEEKVTDTTRFLTVWEAGVDDHVGNDDVAAVFVWAKKVNMTGQYEFGDFGALECPSPQSAINIARWANNTLKQKFMITTGETVIKWLELRQAMSRGYMHVADASHDTVFDGSATMKVRKAFPYLFEQAPKPGPNAP